jgi:hypothetical protein
MPDGALNQVTGLTGRRLAGHNAPWWGKFSADTLDSLLSAALSTTNSLK